MTRYDTIVIGLGGMGGAAAYRLAQRGQRVLGLDKFGPVHDQGSSHGGSRIMRQAYFEAPEYVPLLMRTHELWDELERESGRHLFTRCGGLMLGKPESRAVAGSLLSARQWDLPHELLDADEIRRRFPTLRPDDGEVALFEAGAGLVSPEETVGAHLDLAKRAGAELHHHERVLSWTADSAGVRVHTAQGDYTARDLVACPGAWAPELLADLGVRFAVEREVQYWFAPVDVEPFRPERQPIYVWERERQFYGFPAHDGESVKIGFHHSRELCTADTVDRAVRPEEIAAVAEFAARVAPSLPGRFLRAVTCLYTNTADENFVIARHPAHERVVVACGFSGHGFKFVPVVGEILADLVTQGGTRHPIALFDPARLTGVL